MADERDDGEKAVENKPKNKKPWLLIGGIAFLVIILSVGTAMGALYYAGLFDKEQKKNANSGDAAKGEAIESEEGDEDSNEEEDEAEAEPKKTAVYVPIDSTFVVNFVGESKVRFLQVTVELMTRDEKYVESITTHMPVIRNNLTFLFSGSSYEEVSTVEGKEQLQASALSEVQKIMENETGKPIVEALYFTSFVTQ